MSGDIQAVAQLAAAVLDFEIPLADGDTEPFRATVVLLSVTGGVSGRPEKRLMGAGT